MTKQTETKTPRASKRSADKSHDHDAAKPRARKATAEGQGELTLDKRYPPNKETEAFRGAVAEAGRLAAYAAEALVPSGQRNRSAEVSRVRRDLARDAVAEIIGSGKHKLPDRQRSHAEHAQRKGAAAIG
jgi:hypothetical protein